MRKALLLEKLIPTDEHLLETQNPHEMRFDVTAKGKCGDPQTLFQALHEAECVIAVTSIKDISDTEEPKRISAPKQSKKNNKMSRVHRECERLLVGFLGKHGADEIAAMSERDVIPYCRGKIAGLIGEDAAKAFDDIEGVS